MQTIIAVKVKVCLNKEFGYKANGHITNFLDSLPITTENVVCF